MKPDSTIYVLAKTPAHYEECRKIWKAHPEMGRVKEVGFPTIMAIRDGNIIAFLSTQLDRKKDLVIAGPMVINGMEGHRAFVAIRLVENYELLLKTLSIPRYVFGVDKANRKWIKSIEQIIGKPYAKNKNERWYVRELQ